MFRQFLQGAALVAGMVLPLASASAQSQLGVYSFTGAAGNETSFAVDQQPTNATFSPMTRGAGVQPATRANAFGASGWTTAASYDPAQYYAFSVAAMPGTVLNLTMLGLTEMHPFIGGVNRIQIRSSLDNFSVPLLNAQMFDTTGVGQWAVPLSGAFSQVQNVEFRIYAYGAQQAGATWAIDNVYLTSQSTASTGGTVQFGTASQVVSEGTRFVQVPVTLTNPGTLASTARVRVAGGSATANSDYTFASQNVIWTGGQAGTLLVTFPIVDDNLVEGPETIRLMLDNPAVGTTIGGVSNHVITIADNDSSAGPGPATIEFVGQGTAVQEGQMASVPLRLTLPQALTSPQTVRVRSWSQTATVGVDYYRLDTLLYIPALPAGVHNLGTVLVTKDDNVVEPTETVTIFFDSTGATFQGRYVGSYNVAIIDNDTTGNPGGQPTVAFGQSTIWTTESVSQVSIPVTVTNRNFNQTTSVTVRLAANPGTATAGADYQYSTQTLSFPAGTAATQYAVLTVVNDQIQEGPETVQLELVNVSNGSVIGQPGTITITIMDDSTTTTVDSIGRVTQTDAQGVATYLGRTVRLHGVVTSGNLNTAGYLSALQDATGGISLYRSPNYPAPNLNEGDEVEVTGSIIQVRGLTQLNIDTWRVLRTGQLLPQMRLVAALDESTESELLELNVGYALVNPAQWTNNPAGFTVDITSGTRTLAMYIAPGTNLVGSAAPSGVFGVIGLGTQIASRTTAPFLDGYAITPRSPADLLRVTGLPTTADRATFSLYPNPAADRLTVQAATAGTATVLDATGRVVLTAPLGAGATEVPVQALRPGLYVVRVGQAAQRFVKQ